VVELLNDARQILPRPTLVAMATRVGRVRNKIGYNSVYI